MEKKIEVEIDGRKYRISPHMIDDVTRFGASVIKRQTKEVPKELLTIPAIPEIKKTILPPTNLELLPEVKKEIQVEVLPPEPVKEVKTVKAKRTVRRKK